MRTRLAAVVTVAVCAAAGATAEPVAAPGWHVETIAMPGAVLSGLSSDRGTLVVADLATGRLLRRDADGALVPFGPQFPHGIDVIGDPTGPYRAIRVGDTLVVAQGWTPMDAEPGPWDHALIAVGDDGTLSVLSDRFWNPFDLVADDGTLYVVDAAANAIERLAADGSGQTTLVRFPRLIRSGEEMQTLSPTEFAATEPYETDAVPTGLALRDGRIHVALFGGFPFLSGAGEVVSFAVGDTTPIVRRDLGGLNAPVALAFDEAGRLLVLEHGLYDQASGFRAASGRLLAADLNATTTTVVLDGLTRPASVLVIDNGTIAVSELAGNLHLLTRQRSEP
jgi:hypothetical protein